MPTFGSLFSGIGGLDLGLERAGWTCRWMVEIDDFCRKVLHKHWPINVPKFSDIRKLTGEELSPVDMIAGGFPCQDISVAGKRGGIHAERSGLFFDLMRVARVVRPRFLLLENVSGLLSRSEWMGAVLEELAASGYDAEWDCIPAAAVGAPHLRDRVFIVGYTNGLDEGALRRIFRREATESKGSGDVANAPSSGRKQDGHGQLGGQEGTVVNADGSRLERRISSTGGQAEERAVERSGQDVSDSDDTTPTRQREHGRQIHVFAESERSDLRRGAEWWSTEPDVGGSSDGFPLWLERHIGEGMSHEESSRAVEALRDVWSGDVAQAVWSAIRGLNRLQATEVLFTFLREYEEGGRLPRILMESAEALEDELLGVRLQLSLGSPPSGWESREQQSEEHSDALRPMPCKIASWDTWEGGIDRVAKGVPKRVGRLRGLGNAVVPQVAEHVGRLILRAFF